IIGRKRIGAALPALLAVVAIVPVRIEARHDDAVRARLVRHSGRVEVTINEDEGLPLVIFHQHADGFPPAFRHAIGLVLITGDCHREVSNNFGHVLPFECVYRYCSAPFGPGEVRVFQSGMAYFLPWWSGRPKPPLPLRKPRGTSTPLGEK